MSLTVEITEQALSRERQAALADLLIQTAGMEPEEASLTALVMPCAIGPMASAEAQRSLLAALQQAGFAARAGAGEPGAAYQAPAYPAPPVYAPPPAYPAAPPVYSPSGAYAPLAAGPYAPTPAPKASSNTAIIAVAAVLGVAVIALTAILLLQNKDTPDETIIVPTTDTPPSYGSTSISSGDDDTMMADTMAMMETEPMAQEPEPIRSDGADYALGYSPSQGVNWSLFSQGSQTRYAAAPNRTPIPVRDAPSGRHGRTLATISPGDAVQTDGCLPSRPEDGARWCRTGYAGGEGWVYDRYLQGSRPQAPRQAPPARTARRSGEDYSAPNIIILGSYQPYDQAGLEQRLAQARQTGLPLQTATSDSYGMSPGLTVIVAGPYSRDEALRLLDVVRRYVPDAFRKALD